MIMQLLHTQLKQLWWYLSLKKFRLKRNWDQWPLGYLLVQDNGSWSRCQFGMYIPVDSIWYNKHLISTPPIPNSLSTLFICKLSVPKAKVTFKALTLNRLIRWMNYEWTLSAILNIIKFLELKFLFFIKELRYIVKKKIYGKGKKAPPLPKSELV